MGEPLIMTWPYQATPELSDEQYARWQSLLEQRTGIYFSQHKSILQKGLSQRMREIGADDYEQYFQQVSAVPEGTVEWLQLVDRISVKETSFFREPHSFEVVQKYLLELLSGKPKQTGDTLDMWSVGCSTGEEAYSLAIQANEVMDYLSAQCFLGVMATDISPSVLQQAKQGEYVSRKVDAVPAALKNKYFSVSNKGYRVVDSLRQRLCFAQGNVLGICNIPRLAMDVIFCQNVFVYFRKERQQHVLNALFEHLKPGGLLIVGPGEVMSWQHPHMRRYKDNTVQAYIKNNYLANRVNN